MGALHTMKMVCTKTIKAPLVPLLALLFIFPLILYQHQFHLQPLSILAFTCLAKEAASSPLYAILHYYRRYILLAEPNPYLLPRPHSDLGFTISILPPTPAILLVIYASSAYVVSGNPAPENTAPSTQRFGKWAGVKIFLFDDTNCGQSYIYPEPGTEVVSKLVGNLWYGKMLHSDFTFQSYNLSRFLSSEERLDWSNPYPSGAMPIPGVPNKCGTFVQTTSPDSNGNSLHERICYLLDPGATVRDCARKEDHKP